MRILLLASAVFVLAATALGQPTRPTASPEIELKAKLDALKDRPEELWVFVNGIVLDLSRAGRSPEALEFAKVNLELAGKLYPRTHPRMVKSLAQVGQMYVMVARYEEGEPYLWEALSRALAEKRADKDMIAIANNLADCRASLGKFEEAIQIYETAIGINQKLGLGGSPQQAVVLDNLGEAYQALGRHEDALSMFQAALEINAKQIPVDHPDSIETIGHIAGLHVARGDVKRAEEYYERLLAMSRGSQGRWHPDVAKVMRDLAHAYGLQGRHQEADHLMHHALEIMEAAFGKDHPNLAGYLEEAGRIKLASGDAQRAEELFTRALDAVDRAAPGSASAAAIADNLASAELALGKLSAAEMHASRALALVEDILPPGHAQHLTVLSTLATVMFQAEKYEEAIDLNSRMIALLEQAPARAELLADVYQNQAVVLRRVGRMTEADDVERKRMTLLGRGLPRS